MSTTWLNWQKSIRFENGTLSVFFDWQMIRVTRGRVRVIGNREEIDNGVIGYLTCRVIHCARHCPDSIIAHPQSVRC